MSTLQPHKSTYWLYPKIKCWTSFVIRGALICNLIISISTQNLSKQFGSQGDKNKNRNKF